MRSRWRCLLVLLCACKAEIGMPAGGPIDANSTDDGPPVDAGDVDATGTFGPWATPMMVPGASTAGASEDDATLSNSKLEMVFSLSDPNIDSGRKHLYYMQRATDTSLTWSAPVRLSFNVDGSADETPRFSADDLTIYFASGRAGGNGGLDVWQVTRPVAGTPNGWGTPTLVAAINSAQTDKWCMPCANGRYLMISSRQPTSTNDDVYEGAIGAAPTRVAELSAAGNGDTGAFISADCLTAYFASTRSGTNRIYRATRTTPTGTWSPPVLVDDFLASVGGAQEDPWISADGKTFVFSVSSNGDKDVYITTR